MSTNKTSDSDQLLKALVAEQIERTLRQTVEPLVKARVHKAVAEAEARVYSDVEVCSMLGGISRTTLWKIRKRGLLRSTALFPGGPRRTTLLHIREYIAGIEADDGEVVDLNSHRSFREAKPRRKSA